MGIAMTTTVAMTERWGKTHIPPPGLPRKPKDSARQITV